MKKKIIYLSIILVLVISVITLSSIYKSKDNKYKKEYNTIPKGLAIMIKEDGATDYVQSNSKDIPKGNYVLNEEKTHCENNGKVTNYNSATGKISLNFIGSDRCYLYFDYYFEPKGYEKILLDNGNGATTVAEAKAYIEGRTTSTTPNFANTATTNEGMYAKEDDYTATTGMKSYYYRGAVDNNWVKFGKEGDKDIYWRIIRINGDGSIRMIYSGTTKPSEDSSVTGSNGVYMTGTGTQITNKNFKFNSSINKAEYVGYQYIEGQQHGFGKCDGTNNASCTVNGNTVYNSTIKQTIDKWYAGTTLKDNDLIAYQIFCNDRSASSTQTAAWTSTGADYYYGANGRLNKNKAPILTCPEESDKFTVGTSNGNGALTYPVGLITVDEIALAGGKLNFFNRTYYLYTNQSYWSGSPFGFYSSGRANEFNVNLHGVLDSFYVDSFAGARPVVSLSSKAKLSGSGTYDDVYTVVGGNSTEDTPSGKSFDTVFAANNTDIFNENGIRYEGADPNNYICLDNKTSGACSSSSLLFRIIGLFDEEYSSDGTTSAGTKKLLKILDTNNYGGTSGKYWSGSSSNKSNNWSKSTLKTELNGTYLNTLCATSGVNSKLSSAIVNSKWHLGGANSTSGSNYYSQTITTENYYKAERSPYATNGTLQNLYSGNPEYVFAKVGLMYPSDYGYATVGGSATNKAGCRAKALCNWYNSSYSDCKNNDWLFKSSPFIGDGEWFISPLSSGSGSALILKPLGYVYASASVYGNQLAVRPTFYLDSSILKIVGGLGTKDNAYRVG